MTRKMEKENKSLLRSMLSKAPVAAAVGATLMGVSAQADGFINSRLEKKDVVEDKGQALKLKAEDLRVKANLSLPQFFVMAAESEEFRKKYFANISLLAEDYVVSDAAMKEIANLDLQKLGVALISSDLIYQLDDMLGAWADQYENHYSDKWTDKYTDDGDDSFVHNPLDQLANPAQMVNKLSIANTLKAYFRK